MKPTNTFQTIQTQLNELSNTKISSKQDLKSFFISVNGLIKQIHLYADVDMSVKEIFELIHDYIAVGTVNAEIQYDIPLFLKENELATDFIITFINDEGQEEEKTADIVLQCDIRLENKDFYITPQVFFIVYDSDDEEEELEEEEDVEGTQEEDFGPELSDDEVVKDVLRNIILSKIYDEGYEYPNEETIEELVDKLFHMINDTLSTYLNVDISDEKEEEEEEEDGDGEITHAEPPEEDVAAPPPVDDYTTAKKLKGGDMLEIHEEQEHKYFFIITARYGTEETGMVQPFVIAADSETEAKRKFSTFADETYANKGKKWYILDILKLEKHELFG